MRDLSMFANMLKMIRIHIVAGGLAAFSLGVLLAMLAGAAFDPARVVLGYLVVFFGDLSTHYSNDYFDTKVDWDGEQDKIFGGSGILLRHPELQPLSRLVAVALMILSVALAAVSVLLYGVPSEFLIIAIVANLLGWFYSAPPLCLSSRGLGEIAIAVGTGLVIPGSGYFVTKRQFDLLFLLLAIPFILYGFLLSLSLEAPDMENDLKTGKTNLVVRKGRHFAFFTIAALSFLATIVFFIYAKTISHPTVIDLRVVAVFSCIPLFAGLSGSLRTPEKSEEANRFGAANIVALFIFNMLVDVYFVILLFLQQPPTAI